MANGQHISLHVKDFNHSTRSNFDWLDPIQSVTQPSERTDIALCHLRFIDFCVAITRTNTHLAELHSHYQYNLEKGENQTVNTSTRYSY